jgi:hypothetical protein
MLPSQYLLRTPGFLTSTLLSAYYPTIRSRLPFHTGPALPFLNPLQALGPRQLLLSAMTLIWAGRLGSFLTARIGKHGKDSRFDEIKKDKIKFSAAWYTDKHLLPHFES